VEKKKKKKKNVCSQLASVFLKEGDDMSAPKGGNWKKKEKNLYIRIGVLQGVA